MHSVTNPVKNFPISFIGAGRVGKTLAKILFTNSYNIKGVYSRRKTSVKEAIKFITQDSFEKTIPKAFESLEDTINEAKIIFLTVNDDNLLGIAKKISLLNIDFEDKLFIHTSGSLSVDILNCLKEKGAKIASMHPLQTIPSGELGVKRIMNIYWAYEAIDKQTEVILKRLISAFKGKSFKIDKNQKTLYHISAVFASNYFVTLIHLAEHILKKAKLPPAIAEKCLFPLIRATLDNIETVGTIKSLTGPIARGDLKVIKNHLDALKNISESDFLKLYKLLGSKTAEIAYIRKSINKKTLSQLRKLLQK